MTEGENEIERPRSRSPPRTFYGSSGQPTRYPRATFTTPSSAATTSYSSPTFVIDPYEECTFYLKSLGINPDSIPIIVGKIDDADLRGLKYCPDETKKNLP
ncbi:hypothetical protein MTR_6g022100 [Medicago truncatula]|uniref:Uncharacterized protein n=1 Tax=Medicago truncatula TaxID=3880 RepID=A0A072U6W6_MEDTR|nr:hypothetical protein MTR_6g022100 [Medicago truncatula]